MTVDHSENVISASVWLKNVNKVINDSKRLNAHTAHGAFRSVGMQDMVAQPPGHVEKRIFSRLSGLLAGT